MTEDAGATPDNLSLGRLFAQARHNEQIARTLFEIEVQMMAAETCGGYLDDLADQVRQRFGLADVWLVLAETGFSADIGALLQEQEARIRVLLVPEKDYMALTGRARKPLLVDCPAPYSLLLPPPGHVAVQSVAFLPLVIEHNLVGALALGSEQPERYGPGMEGFFLEQLAVKASIGLTSIWAREQLRRLAIRDPLTGLLNRRELELVLRQELSRAQRYNLPLSLLFIDCDDFKQVNDTYGHDCGDAYLCYFAKGLIELVRENDRVFRFAGDEFVVLLPNQNAKDSEPVMKRLDRYFASHPMFWESHEVPVRFSQGLASADKNTDPASMLREADQHLYRNKNARKGNNDYPGRVAEAKA
jgi:diguanylate cyclase (GGDEF)-like protein